VGGGEGDCGDEDVVASDYEDDGVIDTNIFTMIDVVLMMMDGRQG